MIASAAHLPLMALEGMSSSSLLRHFVLDGGPITWGILVPLSVVAMALTIRFLLTVRRKVETPRELADELTAAAQQGQYRQMLELTRDKEGMLPLSANAGLTALPAGRDSARAAIEEAVDERASRLIRRVEYLNILGNVCPMIGLFGTVVGMIQAFNRIFAAGGTMPDAGKLAGDIAVALVTTFWGLLIAIPAMAAHAVFRNRIDAYAAECLKLCDSLVNVVARQASAAAAARQAAAQATSPPPRPAASPHPIPAPARSGASGMAAEIAPQPRSATPGE